MTRSSVVSALALSALLGAASGVAGQVVRGLLSDAETGAPVVGARVQLLTADGGVVAAADTDSEGIFELRARLGGAYAISAERIGYAAFRSEPLTLEADATLQVRLRMGVDAVPLAPLVVLADSQLRRGRLADFERRRVDPSISGHFLDAGDIRARPVATPTQLLRTLPSVDLYQVQTFDNPSGLDRSLIYLPGSRGGSLLEGRCLAQVFVNGIPFRQTQDGVVTVDDMLDGVPIVGVELYTRASSAPLAYRGSGECGVVLYWTEEPTASTRGWGLKRIAIGLGLIVGVLFVGFSG